MTQRDHDRRAALGWIAGQLAWESRLQTLRTEPDAESGTDLIPDAEPVEVEPAA